MPAFHGNGEGFPKAAKPANDGRFRQVYLRYAYYVHRSVPRPQGNALADELTEAWESDIVIWSNKCFRERPILNNKDGPIGRFRDWYQQFYD